jgi:predicted HTH domain antitoxin
LAGTIKIIDGVKWKPELLDHNTAEWKNLAKEVETQLNDVYSKSERLSKWYQNVRIDSFSQGSVLVDYFVELADVSRDLNTQEIKQMFHDALTTVPVSVVPLNGENGLSDQLTNGNDFNDSIDDLDDEIKPQKMKDNYLLGKFVLDPMATDFIVIRKQRVIPTVENIEQNALIPQWAMAVIVIGVGSLLFVVIFGVAVLLNRQKRSKKKAPIPLTADMLNELNKNHMGGFENYGHEDLYNIDDAWDDKADIKPKRFTNSIHGSSGSNIYDSWRSQRHTTSNYYYDQQLHYPQKSSQYPPADPYMDAHYPYQQQHVHHPHHQALQSAMGLHTYNPRRYYRDPDC